MNADDVIKSIWSIVQGWAERVECPTCGGKGKHEQPVNGWYACVDCPDGTIPNPLRETVLPLVTVECDGALYGGMRMRHSWWATHKRQPKRCACHGTGHVPRKLADMWRGPEPMRAEVELAYWHALCAAMGWELYDRREGDEYVWDVEGDRGHFVVEDAPTAAAAVLAAFEKEAR